MPQQPPPSFTESLFTDSHPLTANRANPANAPSTTSAGINPALLSKSAPNSAARSSAVASGSGAASPSHGSTSTPTASSAGKKKNATPASGRDGSTERATKKARLSTTTDNTASTSVSSSRAPATPAAATPTSASTSAVAGPSSTPAGSSKPVGIMTENTQNDPAQNWIITTTNKWDAKYSIRVTFSDGDKKYWPPEETTKPPLEGAKSYDYHLIQTPGTEKSLRWKKQLGEHLALALGKATAEAAKQWILEDFPAGYQLYTHEKNLNDGKQPRRDAYLHGNKDRFRSVNEFRPHIEALARGINCHCKYCGGSKLQNVINQSLPALQPGSTPQGSVPKGQRQTYTGPYGSSLRENDLAPTASPYRRGELVWLKLEKPLRPAAASGASTTSLSTVEASIEYWPGVVLDALAVQPSGDPSAPLVRRHARLLSIGDNVTVIDKDILPWLAYAAPPAIFQNDLSNPDSVRHVYDLRTLEQEIRGELGMAALPPEEDKMDVDGVDKSKKLGNYYRPKLTDFSTVEDAITTLALSLQIAAHVITMWCHLDPFNDPRGTSMKFYQGLFWGPERLWTGDLVRLLTPRKDLPTNIRPPSRGDDVRACFFLKIRSLSRNELNKAVASGDIWELADERWFEENEKPLKEEGDEKGRCVSDRAREKERHFPKPPKGHQWRLLTEIDGEHIFEVYHIAGRYYQDLSLSIADVVPAATTAGDSQAPPSPAPSPPPTTTTMPGGTTKKAAPATTKDKVKALNGLMPGQSLFSRCRGQTDSRKDMMNKAEGTAHHEMQEYFRRTVTEKLEKQKKEGA